MLKQVQHDTFEITAFSSLLQECGNLSTEKIQNIHKQFQSYQQIIQKYNNKFNLISHNDLDKIWKRHFFDSIIPIKLFTNEFRFIHNKKAIDIGTGAGFPGLALALVCSELSISLVDSMQKKSRFLENILIPGINPPSSQKIPLNPPFVKGDTGRLGKRGISVLSIRAETLAHQKEHRGQYDFAFTRALAKPRVALELLLPFVKIGGTAFFWTSGKDWAEQEKIEKHAQLLGAEFYKKKEYFLPDENKKREILALKKVSHTDPKFPRKPHHLLHKIET